MCDACMWVCSVHTCMWRPDYDRCLLLFLPYRQGLSLNRKLTILTRLTAHHGPRICLFQLEIRVSASCPMLGLLYVCWRFELKSVCLHSESPQAPGCVIFLRQNLPCTPGWLWTRISLPALVSQVWDTKCALPHLACVLISGTQASPLSCFITFTWESSVLISTFLYTNSLNKASFPSNIDKNKGCLRNSQILSVQGLCLGNPAIHGSPHAAHDGLWSHLKSLCYLAWIKVWLVDFLRVF